MSTPSSDTTGEIPAPQTEVQDELIQMIRNALNNPQGIDAQYFARVLTPDVATNVTANIDNPQTSLDIIRQAIIALHQRVDAIQH